jgi:CBS domain-containing protein
MKTVGDVMNPSVTCAKLGMSVREVEALLAERRVTGAPVVDDDGRAVGVISQHDLILHAAGRTTAGESGRFQTDVDDYRDLAQLAVDLSDEPVEKLMTTDVITIGRDDSVAKAAREMRERRVHRLLVTHRGTLVGIVSSIDLLQAITEE